jgi:hypothetical protein
MSIELLCPRCNQRLRVASDAAERRWLTCPRCLASIHNPSHDTEDVPVEEEVLTDAPALRDCPSCGRLTEPGWHFCPHCECSLVRGSSRRSQLRRRPDDDTVVDNRGVNVGLMMLGILLVAGVLLFTFTGGLGLILDQRQGDGLLVAGGTLLALLVIGVLVIGASTRNQRLLAFSGGIASFLAGAGVACLIVLALCIGVLNTCLHNVH